MLSGCSLIHIVCRLFNSLVFMAALPSKCGHYIFAVWFLSFYLSIFLFFPRLISAAADWMSTIVRHIGGPSANLECRSEMCCTRLAANAGPKKVAKNRHLGTIAQLFRAISSQLRHVSTVWKKLVKQQYLSTCPHNMGNFGPLAAEIVSLVWGTPGNFNGFCILAALLHGTLVVGVSQTLRRWIEGATYIWQGGHHVGHWLTF